MFFCFIVIVLLFFFRVVKLFFVNKWVFVIFLIFVFLVNFLKLLFKKLFLCLCLMVVKFFFKIGCFSKLWWFVLNYEVWWEIYGKYCFKMMNRCLFLCFVVRMIWGYLLNNLINVIFLRWVCRFICVKYLNKYKGKYESGNRVYWES